MRELDKQALYDILNGCAIAGTGGGGSPAAGIALIDRALADGRVFRLASLAELPDDGLIGVPYCCGALTEQKENPLAHLTELPEPHGVLAARAMERYMDYEFDGFMSTELGGANTAQAFYTAAVMGRPIADADPAGRSVPELQHSTFFLHDIPIAPMAVADAYGNSAVFDRVTSDERAEHWARALAVVSNNTVGVLDHTALVRDIRGAVIEGAITFAEKLGAALRTAKESKTNPADAVIKAGRGKRLFDGEVTAAEFEDRDGFTFGTIILKGIGNYLGHEYKIWYKNENIISWLDGKIHATVPDLICMLDDAGEQQINPFVKAGQKFTVFALPAPAQWTTQRGLDCFGPRSFGFDVDYRPICL
ncbi:MAG: DUF917 domain-containing protein [Defluviitaleaceae bacterium]|nr:DUF917 domain-containing protein [Defluviitaleaceae bacterium]